jgi:hypothetical protein
MNEIKYVRNLGPRHELKSQCDIGVSSSDSAMGDIFSNGSLQRNQEQSAEPRRKGGHEGATWRQLRHTMGTAVCFVYDMHSFEAGDGNARFEEI